MDTKLGKIDRQAFLGIRLGTAARNNDPISLRGNSEGFGAGFKAVYLSDAPLSSR